MFTLQHQILAFNMRGLCAAIVALLMVVGKDIDLKRLGAVFAVAHEQDLRDFASLLLVEGLGPRTLQSLALIAEVVHGAPSRFSDPARFSFADGGKDGHHFPVPLKTYDAALEHEHAIPSSLIGRTVFDGKPSKRQSAARSQLDLFG